MRILHVGREEKAVRDKMKQNEVKKDTKIISPNGSVWIVVKKYSKDFILIRRGHKKGKLCALTKGQFKMFKVKTKKEGSAR